MFWSCFVLLNMCCKWRLNSLYVFSTMALTAQVGIPSICEPLKSFLAYGWTKGLKQTILNS